MTDNNRLRTISQSKTEWQEEFVKAAYKQCYIYGIPVTLAWRDERKLSIGHEELGFQLSRKQWESLYGFLKEAAHQKGVKLQFNLNPTIVTPYK